MCLLLVAIDPAPHIRLVLLANRDEFHARAAAAAAPWPENGHVVGGRDCVAGGSWLAVRDDGHFAAVTNLRSGLPAAAPASRGWLVRDFVLGHHKAAEFLASMQATSAHYGPFNLVAGDGAGVFSLCSAEGAVRHCAAGIHVVSNGAMGARWPKSERLRQRFAETFTAEFPAETEPLLLDLLVDETRPDDALLPDTGVGLERERLLSPIFIRGADYGTRASTIVACHSDGSVVLRERRYGPSGQLAGEVRWSGSAGVGFKAMTFDEGRDSASS